MGVCPTQKYWIMDDLLSSSENDALLFAIMNSLFCSGKNWLLSGIGNSEGTHGSYDKKPAKVFLDLNAPLCTCIYIYFVHFRYLSNKFTLLKMNVKEHLPKYRNPNFRAYIGLAVYHVICLEISIQ